MIEDLAVCLRYKAFLWHMQHDVSSMMSISHWCVSVDSCNVYMWLLLLSDGKLRIPQVSM